MAKLLLVTATRCANREKDCCWCERKQCLHRRVARWAKGKPSWIDAPQELQQQYPETEAAIRPQEWEAAWILRPCPVCGTLFTEQLYNKHSTYRFTRFHRVILHSWPGETLTSDERHDFMKEGSTGQEHGRKRVNLGWMVRPRGWQLGKDWARETIRTMLEGSSNASTGTGERS